jgi:hypothetical protein
MSPPVKLEFSEKYDSEHAQRYFFKHQQTLASKLSHYCSGLMKPDTHLGENARQIEVSDDQTTPLLYS